MNTSTAKNSERRYISGDESRPHPSSETTLNESVSYSCSSLSPLPLNLVRFVPISSPAIIKSCLRKRPLPSQPGVSSPHMTRKFVSCPRSITSPLVVSQSLSSNPIGKRRNSKTKGTWCQTQRTPNSTIQGSVSQQSQTRLVTTFATAGSWTWLLVDMDDHAR